MKQLQELKAHLLSNPQIQTIYFNDKQEWLFSPHVKFPTAVSRDEVINNVEDDTESVELKVGYSETEKIADLSKTIEDLTKNNAEVSDDNAKLQAQVYELTNDKANLETEKAACQASIESLTNENDSLKTEAVKLQGAIDALNAKQDTVKVKK